MGGARGWGEAGDDTEGDSGKAVFAAAAAEGGAAPDFTDDGVPEGTDEVPDLAAVGAVAPAAAAGDDDLTMSSMNTEAPPGCFCSPGVFVVGGGAVALGAWAVGGGAPGVPGGIGGGGISGCYNR